MKPSSLAKTALGQGQGHRAAGNEATAAVSWRCGACTTNATAPLEWSAQRSEASKFIRRAQLGKFSRTHLLLPFRTCLYHSYFKHVLRQPVATKSPRGMQLQVIRASFPRELRPGVSPPHGPLPFHGESGSRLPSDEAGLTHPKMHASAMGLGAFIFCAFFLPY